MNKEEFLSIETLTCGGRNPLHTVDTGLRVLFFGPDQDKEVICNARSVIIPYAFPLDELLFE